MKALNRDTTIANRLPEAFSEPSNAESEGLGLLSTTKLFLSLFSPPLCLCGKLFFKA